MRDRRLGKNAVTQVEDERHNRAPPAGSHRHPHAVRVRRRSGRSDRGCPEWEPSTSWRPSPSVPPYRARRRPHRSLWRNAHSPEASPHAGIRSPAPWDELCATWRRSFSLARSPSVRTSPRAGPMPSCRRSARHPRPPRSAAPDAAPRNPRAGRAEAQNPPARDNPRAWRPSARRRRVPQPCRSQASMARPQSRALPFPPAATSARAPTPHRPASAWQHQSEAPQPTIPASSAGLRHRRTRPSSPAPQGSPGYRRTGSPHRNRTAGSAAA